MKDGKVVLAIDFDNTIVENAFPEVGALKLHAKEVLSALDKSGCKIIIHTCRTNPTINTNRKLRKKYLNDMVRCLKDNCIPYDEIWTGKGKPLCHLFIDDCALPFISWFQVLADITGMIKVMNNKGDANVKV